MASSFGKSKPPIQIGPSADDILQMYRDDTMSAEHHIRKIKREALTQLTMNWFLMNPITTKNMAEWGQILCEHLNRNAHKIEAEAAQPLAEYLKFLLTVKPAQLIPSYSKHSKKYDALRDLVDVLVPAGAFDVHSALFIIARDKSVDLHAVMTKLDSMSEEQTGYDEYVLDNDGEYRNIPAGVFMHGLVGLSLDGPWEMPKDDPMYHQAWSVLDDGDLEWFTGAYDPECDIVGHLATVLPKSTYEALEFYETNHESMTAEQKQHVLGMSLSHMNFPEDFQQLLYAIYYNAGDNTQDAQQIFAAINPAADVLSTLVALYDNPEDVIKDLKTNPKMKDLILVADAMRKKENADGLVATFEF